MGVPLMKDLLEKAGTRYRLVIMASQRARFLQAHAKPLVTVNDGLKPVSIALKEIDAEKITYKELKKAKKSK